MKNIDYFLFGVISTIIAACFLMNLNGLVVIRVDELPQTVQQSD